ncbi:hypothetical protein KUV65_15765 [Maritalea mobilis]|uniref:hypothetical protein n=1 Tax=Maritalea mobilis TaxID=483324 RepID=UPI001C957378|nr:hypothetical protein [Maritalea mobilis]MBY6202832.1 hypothetical protein [Maritalea mobilis]
MEECDFYSIDIGFGFGLTFGFGSVRDDSGGLQNFAIIGIIAGLDLPLEYSVFDETSAVSVDQLHGLGVGVGLNWGAGGDYTIPVFSDYGPYWTTGGEVQAGVDGRLTYTFQYGNLDVHPIPDKSFVEIEGIPLDPIGSLDATISHRSFAVPKLFDINGDGVLDANDTNYGEFRVWQSATYGMSVDGLGRQL